MKKAIVILTMIWVINLTFAALPSRLVWEVIQADSKKDLIYRFCSSVFEEGKTNVKVYVLEPSYSLFLFNLCQLGDYPIENSAAKKIAKNSFEPTNKNCYVDSSLANECPLAQETAQLFKDVMDEYFNLKEINILGVWDTDVRKSIEKFSKKYFPAANCDQKWSFLLDNQGEGICYHPQTYEYLKEVIESLSEEVNKTYFIDWYKLLSSEDKFYAQGFSKATPQLSDADWFRNIVWNELYFYLLWMESYKQWMLNNEKLLPFLPPWGVKLRESIVQKEVVVANSEVTYAIDALQKAFDMLKQIQKTFPIHVWLKIYLEDLKKFRDNLAKVYTPLHQLYYKIRNVQNIQR